MKLKKGFIMHGSGREVMLVAAGASDFNGLVKGNKTFGAILALLKNDISEAEIVSALHEKYSAPSGVIEQDVSHALSELRRIGALEE